MVFDENVSFTIINNLLYLKLIDIMKTLHNNIYIKIYKILKRYFIFFHDINELIFIAVKYRLL